MSRARLARAKSGGGGNREDKGKADSKTGSSQFTRDYEKHGGNRNPGDLSEAGAEINNLKGIIAGMSQKMKKTEDLEKEIDELRSALSANNQSRQTLRLNIESSQMNLKDHQTKAEKFQKLIIDENENLNSIIVEKD